MHIFLHIIAHTLEESLIIFPILLVTYIFMEWLEHRAKDKTLGMIRVAGKFGPVIGGLVGVIPQCGFSGAAASFYATHSITLGTLIAIFMATSDEMIPILISASFTPAMIAKILIVKCGAGIICGYIIDLIYKRHPKIEANHIHDFCEQENCDCDEGIFKPALKHTINIFLLVLAVSIVIHLAFELAEGQDMTAFIDFWNIPVVSHLVAGIIGLIPNCAASVFITDMYVEGVINISVMLTGLFVNAGVGLLVLYKVNHHLKENIVITAVLYACGVVIGMLCGFLF